VNIEIVNTGSELMLGRVVNSHQQWLCQQLASLGWVVDRQVAVPDTAFAIRQAVQEALTRADAILTTGGLGPTSDDITRDEIARLLGRSLRLDDSVLAVIQHFYTSRQRAMPPTTKVQAMVPEGATVLPNRAGTAPGLAIEVARPGRSPALLIMLPGPPRELYPMFLEQVVPLLQSHFRLETPFESLTLKTACLGESVIEEKIAPALEALASQGLEIGYCARVMEVEVRLGARGSGAHALIAAAEQIVRGLFGAHIFGANDDLLEAAIVRELAARRQTLALAESCTGGLIAHRITNVPGASEVFLAGLVTYSNAAKQALLGVSAALLEAHGAVSEPVARAMAEGARNRLGSDYALAATGIAGPGGGTPDKPVGTVYISLASPQGVLARHHVFALDRPSFKQAASQQALDMLRRAMV
jgi:nicotinamide-nucleotide amidase